MAGFVLSSPSFAEGAPFRQALVRWREPLSCAGVGRRSPGHRVVCACRRRSGRARVRPLGGLRHQRRILRIAAGRRAARRRTTAGAQRDGPKGLHRPVSAQRHASLPLHTVGSVGPAQLDRQPLRGRGSDGGQQPHPRPDEAVSDLHPALIAGRRFPVPNRTARWASRIASLSQRPLPLPRAVSSARRSPGLRPAAADPGSSTRRPPASRRAWHRRPTSPASAWGPARPARSIPCR